MSHPNHPNLTGKNKRTLRTAVVLLAGATICIVLAVVWHNGLCDLLIPRNFGEVEPGLYRSGQISSRLIERTLKDHGIAEIVVLSNDDGNGGQDSQAEAAAAQRLGIERQVFPLSGDGTGRIDIYAAAVAAIDKARKENKPVLVHCVAGAQRTGGVIAAYRLLVEHLPADQAVAEMRRFGHDPTANPHLLEYLNDHMAQLAQNLVDLGVLQRVPDPLPVVRAD